jgi:hypothetical protein
MTDEIVENELINSTWLPNGRGWGILMSCTQLEFALLF